jgi:hypothetical protein
LLLAGFAVRLLHVVSGPNGTVRWVRFDKSAADDFLVAVRAGASNEVASQHAGVDYQVVRQWLRGATKATEGFRRDVEKARSDLQLLGIGIVRRAANLDPDRPNVTAATWLAEKAAGDAELERLRELTT